MHRSLGWFAALCAIATVVPAGWAQCTENCPERRTISVNGTGDVTADADLALVRVGYKLYGPDAKAAYASALEASNAIMSALKASGVPGSAIESTSQVLQHTPPYELQQFSGTQAERAWREFTVTQSWVIRVKPDDAAKTLNVAITAGANESGWIQWIVQNPDALEGAATSKAVENARKIAEEIAAKSNARLGHLVSAQQNQGAGVGSIGSIGGPIEVGVQMALPAANQQLAINSRRVESRVQVYAVFAIE